MTIGVLANENFPEPAIRKLRAAGVDVVAVAETMPSASDADILERARSERRWLVTFDRDYGELVFKEGLPRLLRFSTREDFKIGDTASFVDRHQQTRVGKIVRLNLKTATLECDNGEWRVSYGLLQHLVDI